MSCAATCAARWATIRTRVLAALTVNPSRPRKGGDRGYDAGKQVKGRKRHLLVETEGLVIRAVVLAAHWPDRAGAGDLWLVAQPVCPRLQLIGADGAYAGWKRGWQSILAGAW